jgi:hypothetical protein
MSTPKAGEMIQDPHAEDRFMSPAEVLKALSEAKKRIAELEAESLTRLRDAYPNDEFAVFYFPKREGKYPIPAYWRIDCINGSTMVWLGEIDGEISIEEAPTLAEAIDKAIEAVKKRA